MNTVLNEEERKMYQHPARIRRMLAESKTIAMVGLSDKPSRPSHFVATYLQSEGYKIVPVNPRIAGVLGEPAYPDLKSIP
ncbi:MAG: CoA-binding protein, partial [Bacteroidota bacterium]